MTNVSIINKILYNKKVDVFSIITSRIHYTTRHICHIATKNLQITKTLISYNWNVLIYILIIAVTIAEVFEDQLVGNHGVLVNIQLQEASKGDIL